MSKLIIKNRYATIPNNLLNNQSISLKAKGLFAFIQSKPDNWDFSKERIAKQLKEGLTSIKSAIKELKENGYLETIPSRNKKGEFIGYDYLINDNPKVGNTDGTKTAPSDNHTAFSKKEYSKKEYSNKDNIAKTSFAVNIIKEFSLKDKLELMVKDKNKHINIIAYYWFYKGIKFENEIQYKAGITRDLRPASRLKGYYLSRIKETMFWLNGTEIDWTLETVHKYIDKNLNKLTEEGGLFYGGEEKTLNINNKNYAN